LSVILSKIKRFRENVVAKNTSVLLVGQVFSRLLQIFYVAALARYIGTAGVGKISIATALGGLTILLVAPGVNTLLVRDVAMNRKVASAYLGNTLFIRALLVIPYIILTIAIGFIVGYPRDVMYIIFIYTLSYLFDALGQIFTSVFQAFETMEYDALAQVARDVINVSLSLLCIFLRQPLIIIVVVSVIAQMCKFMIMGGITHHRLVPFKLNIDLKICKELLVKSLPFGALVILFSIRFQLGTFILSLYDTPSNVGIYSAATTLILMLLMLPGAFSSAVLPAYSRMYRNNVDNLPHFYQLSYKYLTLVGFPIGLIAMLFGGKIIELIYGPEFKSAGMSVIILSGSLFAMMGYSNGPLLNAIGKQRFFAWTQAILVLSDALFCLVFIPRWGPIGAALANTISGVGGLIIHSIVCHRQLGLSFPWATILKSLFATFVVGVIIFLANSVGLPWWLVLLAVAPLTYALSALMLKLVKVDELRFLASGAPVVNGVI
jgi:O-antigen/teichoic acid export membrane protein